MSTSAKSVSAEARYGLILPAKERSEAKAAALNTQSKQRNVFYNDSGSDDDEDTDWVKKTVKKQSHGSLQQRQSAQAIRQALADDPTVYQYDELYDEMDEKRARTSDIQKKDRKPKYVENLLKTAEKRKQEDEARTERQVQKERESEGDMFKDKEAFVTGAYRKKMEELETAKQEERRRDALDSLVDVTKQKDLSGFYRHLYRQQLEEPETMAHEAAEKKKLEDLQHTPELKIEFDYAAHSDEFKDGTQEFANKSNSDRGHYSSPNLEPGKDRHKGLRKHSGRSYRQSEDTHREHGSSRKEDDHDRRQNRSDKARRSDRDRDYERLSDRERNYRERRRNQDREHDSIPRDNRYRLYDRKHDRELESDKGRIEPRHERSPEDSKRNTVPPEQPEKKLKLEQYLHQKSLGEIVVKVEMEETKNETPNPQVSMWAKRTIATLFDDALARYFARKQANTLKTSIVPNHS